ncbi:hypothetical protein JHW43_009011 [Diplocarpon mali]|nr:hypothetical protein JHW43_009011 [Diplocarpon mali]
MRISQQGESTHRRSRITSDETRRRKAKGQRPKAKGSRRWRQRHDAVMTSQAGPWPFAVPLGGGPALLWDADDGSRRTQHPSRIASHRITSLHFSSLHFIPINASRPQAWACRVDSRRLQASPPTTTINTSPLPTRGQLPGVNLCLQPPIQTSTVLSASASPRPHLDLTFDLTPVRWPLASPLTSARPRASAAASPHRSIHTSLLSRSAPSVPSFRG